jgi:hypothetical protein
VSFTDAEIEEKLDRHNAAVARRLRQPHGTTADPLPGEMSGDELDALLADQFVAAGGTNEGLFAAQHRHRDYLPEHAQMEAGYAGLPRGIQLEDISK